MVNNSSLSLIKTQIVNGNINWNFTREWINFDPLDSLTNAKLSKLQGAKLKKKQLYLSNC